MIGLRKVRRMYNPHKLVREINFLIGYLVECGLANDQNTAFQKTLSEERTSVTFHGAENATIALKKRPYSEIYYELFHLRAFSVVMLDGALVQMMYMFKGFEIEQHRLAYFHNPDLELFQNNPDIYLQDEIHADIVARHIFGFPFRFDFDARPGRYETVRHPKSHFTLGQYEKCRIPVTQPVGPAQFVDFVLRNFYDTKFTNNLPKAREKFNESIDATERTLVHVRIP